MDFGSLIEAVEAYLRLRREVKRRRSVEPCLDWDCDLATDLEGQASDFMDAELADLRKSLEKAIDRYIDERVRRALEKNPLNSSHLKGMHQEEGGI